VLFVIAIMQLVFCMFCASQDGKIVSEMCRDDTQLSFPPTISLYESIIFQNIDIMFLV